MSKLGDYVNIRTGKLDANASSNNGKYPFFTCSVNPLKIDTYSYDCECVLVAGNGDLNVKYFNGKFDAYQRTYIIESKNKNILSVSYFYCFLNKYVETLRLQAIGGVIKYIKLNNLTEADIIIPSIEKQKVIVSKINKVTDLIDKHKKQLQKLDELVKARFVEMFGTLEFPAGDFDKDILKNLCYKITDGKHGGCTAEEGTKRYFVGAKEIYNNEVHYETAPEINIKEFEKDYKRCNVEIGDFLIVNTGATIGKSAITTDSRTEHTLLQKSVALLKVKKDILNPTFLKYCYKVNDNMYRVTGASAQPNLLLSKINSTEIYVPPIELQNQFADFVKQVEKTKSEVQKSLQKLEMLKKALMQKYFG